MSVGGGLYLVLSAVEMHCPNDSHEKGNVWEFEKLGDRKKSLKNWRELENYGEEWKVWVTHGEKREAR
jgi:hypothetical protein